MPANGKRFATGVSQSAGGGADPMAFNHAAHRTVRHDFIRAVQSGMPQAVGQRLALGVQQPIEGIMESIRTGSAVSLPPVSLPG